MNNNPLCVAQLVETMTMGGAENLAVRIANALAEKGHQSHLIVVTEPGILSERIHPDVIVHYLGSWRSTIRNPIGHFSSLIRQFRLLKAVIIEAEIQIVQTHLPGANFLGLLLEYGKVCPVLATIHNNQEFRYGAHDKPLLGYLRKIAYKQILRRCKGIVAVSEKVKVSLLRDLGAGGKSAAKISVVPNGVEIPELPSSEERIEIRSKFLIPENCPLILAAGRLSEQKNFSDLIVAAGILRERGECFHLLIGGDGEQRAVLENKIEDLNLGGVISMPGNLTNLNEIMLASDVYVMSSLWEGLPLVLLEAMAAGLPAVAYGIPGVEELISTGKNGVVAKTNDSTELADGLALLLKNAPLRYSMGQSGRNLVKEKFSFLQVVEKLELLYLDSRI